MEQRDTINDEQFQDFLDGRLDQEARTQVIQALGAQPEQAVRIVELLVNDAALRRLGQAMLEPDVPQHLTAMIEASRGDPGRAAQQHRNSSGPTTPKGQRAYLRPLAASVLFLLGLGLGWYGFDRIVPQLSDSDVAYSDAMTAFSFYVDEPGAPIQYSHAELDTFLPRVREALGRDLSPPDLLAQGFEFLAGRLLPGADGQAVLYLYQNASDPGDRIGIYVWRMRADGHRSTPLPREAGQFVSRSWNDTDLGYTLLSTPRERDFELLEGDIRKHFDPQPAGT